KTVKSQTVNQWFDSFLLVAGGKSLIMVNRPDIILRRKFGKEVVYLRDLTDLTEVGSRKVRQQIVYEI
ncbi:hypothetical protein, partial [Microcoleus sp. B3-D7]|uniref:hypothetical protein n=1 Tax=Microcoleus sp. B3-D7 TaxID=2818659 RepID=UPI002FD0E612